MSRRNKKNFLSSSVSGASAATTHTRAGLDVAKDFLAMGLTGPAQQAFKSHLAHGRLTHPELAQAAKLARDLGLANELIIAMENIALDGADPEALTEIGSLAMAISAPAQAVRLLEAAVVVHPEDSRIQGLLGSALMNSGRAKLGVACLERALELDPDNVIARAMRGMHFAATGNYDRAIADLGAAAAADPSQPYYLIELGGALVKKALYAEAFEIFERALSYKEARAAAFMAMAGLFGELCDIDKVVYYKSQAMNENPDPGAISSYLFHTLASDAFSDDHAFEEHKRLGQRFDAPSARLKRHPNNPDPERRLKVGFVSGDLYHHSVARFIIPLLRELDRDQFELFAIYNNCRHDHVTVVLREIVEHWHSCFGIGDAALASWIEDQGIDILIDLSGHSGQNRLPMFGMRPAPVQVTYLGYPGTTGMETMDYRITSELLDPAGETERFHTEKLIRLPGLVAPFQPFGNAEIGELPHLKGEPFTFACLNPIWRMTSTVVRVWSEILRAKPDARIMIGNVDTPMLVQHLCNKFAEHGIGAERLLLAPRKKHFEYLELHNQIDLALDTFPYNGGTTTMYKMWMGVPLVSLEGRRTSGRVGACMLRDAGLGQFVAQTEQQFIDIALDWANRPQDLAEIRRTLRDRVKVTHAGDQSEYARHFGDALRQAWRQWCDGAGNVRA